MKKILIISRLFPPENRAGANRAYAWAKYFKERDLYPVFITRDWAWKKFEVTHRKFENYEVYYVPFKQRKSYTFKHAKHVWLRPLGGLFHYWSYLFEYSFWNHPDGRLYRFAKRFLKNHSNQFDGLLVTAPPFIYLRMGFKLAKRFKLRWLADYRDEWNSAGSIFKKSDERSWILKCIDLVKSKDIQLERKWTSEASCITTVSDNGVKNLINILNRDSVYSVPNGFLADDFSEVIPTTFEILTFTYAGTLHATQEVEPFLDAVKKALDDKPFVQLQLIFLGLRHDQTRLRYIKNYLGNHAYVLKATKKVSKKESIQIQCGSHYLLLFRHRANSDIPSSKLYEYAGTGRSVLHFPSDQGVMQNTLMATGQMVLGLNNISDVSNFICEKDAAVRNNSWTTQTPVKAEIQKLERRTHALKMAELLEENVCQN